MQVDPADRQAFVASACENDPASIEEVLNLIELSNSNASGTQTVHYRPTGDTARCFDEGQVIDDRFQILAFLDQGGMGEVYAALDLNLQQKVALKTIRPSIAAHPGAIDRFKKEVKQSLRITHPNVCRVHQLASYHDPGGQTVWFLTMELLEGQTLARCLADGGAIAPDRALVLIRQIVAGLSCAHEAGIVHRDLKPGNLMLVDAGSKGERLVVTDFGLAISVSPGEGAGLAGTPAYMAPEQRRGDAVGPPADLFALGLIICEMLTGARPGIDTASAEHCARQVKEWLPAHPKTHPRLRPVIRRCLQFRAEDRFADAREIVPILGRAKRPLREWMIAGGLTLVAATALGGAAVRGLSERVADAVQLTPDSTVSGEPSLSADGKYLAYMSNRADPENQDIWFQPLPGGAPRRLTRNPAADLNPSVSPDGKLVAFRSEREGGGIYAIGSDGNGERLLAPLGRDPAFALDGRAIAYWTGDRDARLSGELYLLAIDKGTARRLTPDFDDARYPAWSADGRLVLFLGCRSAAADACPDWWAVDPNGGEPVNTGLLALLHRAHIEPDDPPHPSWMHDHVLISGRRGQTFKLWDIVTKGGMPRAAGDPVQVTFGDVDEKAQSVASNGAIVLEHDSGALHLWRIHNASGKAEKLTDSVAPDCCPSASGDARSVFFTRSIAGVRQLMKVDIDSGRESMVYVSPESKFWPLPDATGETVAFESQAGNHSAIMLWKAGTVRTLCKGCSHPGAWFSPKELLYLTAADDIAMLDTESLRSHTVVAHGRYVLANPDWSPAEGHLLFGATKADVKRIFAVRLSADGKDMAGHWIPLSAPAEAAFLGRWSSDGTAFYYFSRADGYYCLWKNSFDGAHEAIGEASAVIHYHDHSRSPEATFSSILGLSVSGDWTYSNIGEVSATVWAGDLRRNPLVAFFRSAFATER
jgi:serine/threonine protein kinase